MNKNEVFDYLDSVRESGICNMFEAPRLIENTFGVDRYEARELAKEWMITFPRRKSDDKRTV